MKNREKEFEFTRDFVVIADTEIRLADLLAKEQVSCESVRSVRMTIDNRFFVFRKLHVFIKQ